MGFYIRKSVSVGPLRFNLSKSGIGVSAGVRGLRFGTGPRGNYVHMGRGGLYYRHTFPSTFPKSRPTDRPPDAVPTVPQHTHGPMEEITSGSVSSMVDSSSAQLLTELNDKFKRISLWPVAAIAIFIVLVVMLAANVATWVTIIVGVMGVAAIIAAYFRDVLAKSVVIMYDLDDALSKAFENCYLTIMNLARCGAVWHVTSQGNVYDRKYHAGASQLANKRRISISDRTPRFVKTNVTIAYLPLGAKSLYFLPDRILVWSNDGVGALAYSDFEILPSNTRFI